MKQLFFFSAIFVCAAARAQYQVVYHRDVIPQIAKNTVAKQTQLTAYNSTIETVRSKREKITEYNAVIEGVQRQVFGALSNASSGLKNARLLSATLAKVPAIYTNLSQCITLAAGKPYLIPTVTELSGIFIARCANLEAYIKNFILSSDETVLITPIKRDQFLLETANEINVLYSISISLKRKLQALKFQDAVNEILPLQLYIQRDKEAVNDILRLRKF